MESRIDAAAGKHGRLAIGLDIGATKIAGGVVSANGVVDSLPIRPTPVGDRTAMLLALTDAVTELCKTHPGIAAIGVGTAGLVEWPDGYIKWAPNNPYEQLPLRQLLQEASELPTIVDNDANTAALAEARLSRAPRHVLFLTIGTGVGGGLILDGKIYRGNSGFAAEVGHLIVNPQGNRRCGCGNIGCLEALASGTALGHYGQQAATRTPSGTIAKLAGTPSNVTGKTVFQAALEGDSTARSLFARAGRWLGIGIASLIAVLDVEAVVIGGGVAMAGDFLLTPTQQSFRQHLFAAPHREPPTITAAELGDKAGWIGAGILALDHASEHVTTHGHT